MSLAGGRIKTGDLDLEFDGGDVGAIAQATGAPGASAAANLGEK